MNKNDTNKNEMIITDEKILIKPEWINVIENKNQCFIISTSISPEKYKVCENNNRESYKYLTNKYGFSEK